MRIYYLKLVPHQSLSVSDACYPLATTFTSLESGNLRAIYCYKLHFVKPVISLNNNLFKSNT